mgnify:CR=1 FL=1
MRTGSRSRAVVWSTFLVAGLLTNGISSSAATPLVAAENLLGLFAVNEGACANGETTGSYFRMIQPGGTPDEGPYVANGDSSCDDKTFSLMEPGSAGGLSTTRFQADPRPAFDSAGNGRASKIVSPVEFFGVDFALSTNRLDPQTGIEVGVPVVTHDGAGGLSGDLAAASAAWNLQHFNQGAPKPDGEAPGLTSGPAGSFDPETGAYVLEWRSTIEGGPFDGFTGLWHLEGVFLPRAEISFETPGTPIAVGQTVAMNGSVAPVSAPETITIDTQRRRSGKWKKYDTKTTTSDDTGAFAYRHAALPKGKYRARAKVAITTDHDAAKSAWSMFGVGTASRYRDPVATTKTKKLKKAAASEPLYGLFRIDAGSCESGGGISGGSYFQMTQPGGNPSSGPYVENGDSACSDKTATPVSPGSDGGFSTSVYQPNPSPAWDSNGNGTAGQIVKPQKWFGVDFASSTNATDPQAGRSVPVPEIRVDAQGNLSGDTSAYSTAWNNEHFNQGSPKPDGSKPGSTSGPTGTYDKATGRYVLEWTSTIQGGPFNNFTGTWHLEGTFEKGDPPARSTTNSSTASGAGSDPATAGGQSLPNTGSPFGGPLPTILVGLGSLGFMLEMVLRRRNSVKHKERP